MKKHIFIIGLILLLLYSSIFPISIGYDDNNTTRIINKNIITVDNEHGDADYTSIKEALNHANPGDNIEVYSGTYYEHDIIIDKEGISLIGISHELGNGSNTGKPYINGRDSDKVLGVSACNVTITGFFIKNSGGNGNNIINMVYGTNNCIISDNNLNDSRNTILICCGCNCKILNNNISWANGDNAGIMILGDNNIISGNTITTCGIGIILYNTGDSHTGSNNTIVSNRISRCRNFGINLEGVGYNTIQYNTIEDNPMGIFIGVCIGIKVEKNNFINNEQQASFQDQEMSFSSGNQWIQNYWNRPRILPYPILGSIFVFIPWFIFDWHPALKPNNS